MQHFKPIISNDASLSGNSFSIVASHGQEMWTVIVACHHWCIKLRHICDTAETLLVVRDGNSNRAVPRLFSASGLIQGYHVYQRIWTPHRRKTNNGKRSRKRTWPICFQRGNAIEILNGIMIDFYPELPHFIQISTTLLAWFPRYRKQSILRELVEVVCNTHICLPSFATG